jgi:hypothetical protein
MRKKCLLSIFENLNKVIYHKTNNLNIIFFTKTKHSCHHNFKTIA